MKFWNCYLECPKCNRKYYYLQVCFNHNGDALLEVDCICGKKLQREMPNEETKQNAMQNDLVDAGKSAGSFEEFQNERIDEIRKDH